MSRVADFFSDFGQLIWPMGLVSLVWSIVRIVQGRFDQVWKSCLLSVLGAVTLYAVSVNFLSYDWQAPALLLVFPVVLGAAIGSTLGTVGGFAWERWRKEPRGTRL